MLCVLCNFGSVCIKIKTEAFRWFCGIIWLLILGTSPLKARASISDSLKVFQKLDSMCDAIDENEPSRALAIATRMEKIAYSIGADSLILKTLMHKCSALGVLGFYDVALKECYKILKMTESGKAPMYEWRALHFAGISYQLVGDYEKSTVYLKKALAVIRQTSNNADTTSVNFEIGFNLMALGNPAASIKVLTENLEAAKRAGDEPNIVLGLDNLANIYYDMDSNDRSLTYLLEILKYPNGVYSDFKRAAIHEHIAELYVALHQWKNALPYLDSAFKYANAIHSNDWLFECYKLKSTIEERKGNLKASLQAHKMYVQLKDSVFRDDYEKKVAAMSSYYDLDKKQSQIALLEKDKLLSSTEIKRQHLQRNAIIGCSVLLLGVLGFALTARHQRKTQQLQVAFSRSLIVEQEQERQRISRELHDSVGQNMLFIRNQMAMLEDKDNWSLGQVMETISTTIEEVRNISKELYPNQLEKYGLSAAVEHLAEKAATATGIFISADLTEIEHQLNKSAAINCYRIVQECLTNAIKHAHAKAIRVTGVIVNKNIELAVMDNGTGFNVMELERKAQTSFGLLNIEERTKMMNGKLSIESTMEGTKITVTIPLNNEV